MANITRIIKVEVDTDTGSVTVLKNELQDVSVELKKVNKKQAETNKLQAEATSLIDKYTGGLLSSVKSWYATAKAAKTALTGVRAGLIATGIGAFIVALGSIVAYWDEIAVAVGIADRASKKHLETSRLLTSEAEKRYELAILEGRIEEKAADDQNDRFEQEKIRLEERLSRERAALAYAKYAAKQLQAELLEEEKKAPAVYGAMGGLAFIYKKVFGISEEDKKEIDDGIEAAELAVKRTQASLNQLLIGYDRTQAEMRARADEEAMKDFFDSVKNLSQALEIDEDEIEVSSGLLYTVDKQLADQRRLRETEGEVMDILDSIIEARAEANIKELNSEESKAKSSIALEERVTQNKLKLAKQGFEAAIMFNEALLGNSEKNAKLAFNIDKALRMGSAVMSTAQAVTAALAQTTDMTPTQSLRYANAIMAGILGSAQVAVIASQQFQPLGGGGGMGGMGGMGGGFDAPQPQFNTVGGSDINQLSASIAAKNNQPVQAYVVAQQVSTAQALERNRTQQATFP